jgi:hypothetical protein
MKRLLYLSISILCLSIAGLIGFNIGSQSAQAQAPEPINGYRVISVGMQTGVQHFVMLSNGDVYWNQGGEANPPVFHFAAQFVGNFWTGNSEPVPVSPETWGKIKSQYKPK